MLAGMGTPETFFLTVEGRGLANGRGVSFQELSECFRIEPDSSYVLARFDDGWGFYDRAGECLGYMELGPGTRLEVIVGMADGLKKWVIVRGGGDNAEPVGVR